MKIGLSLSSGSQRLQRQEELEGQVPYGLLRVAYTQLPCRTHLAVRSTKFNQNIGLVAASDIRSPLLIALSLRTNHHLVVPVNREVLQVETDAFSKWRSLANELGYPLMAGRACDANRDCLSPAVLDAEAADKPSESTKRKSAHNRTPRCPRHVWSER